MTRRFYIQVFPRGFINESKIYWGSRNEVLTLAERINNDPNALATPLPAAHAAVQAAKAYGAKWGIDVDHISAFTR